MKSDAPLAGEDETMTQRTLVDSTEPQDQATMRGSLLQVLAAARRRHFVADELTSEVSGEEPATAVREHLRLRSPGGLGARFYPGSGRPGAARRVLVAIHGVTRNRRSLERELVHRMPREVSLLFPFFSQKRFRGYQRLETGPLGASPDGELLDLLDIVKRDHGGEDRVDLFGFSGGAQFAHRFALLHAPRVASLSVVAAGFYTMPDSRRAFPYGLEPAGALRRPVQGNAFEAYLNIPKRVLVGELDREADRHLRSSSRLSRDQGADRVERARRFAVAMRAHELLTLGELRTSFALLPASAHSFRDCVRRGGLDRHLVEQLSGPADRRSAVAREATP